MAIINYFPGGAKGLSPQIIVTTVSGSIVTATRGEDVVTGTSVDGVCTLRIPDYGVWVLTATLAGDSAVPKTIIVDTVKEYSITLDYISLILNNVPWAQISEYSEEGANFWAVGDRKEITLSGTVGTLSVSGTYCVYILGFNHNEATEGTGIHFGCFKTALTGGKDVCLVDSKYSSNATSGAKYFNMNHSSNTNTGGWKGCDKRYDVLGSVHSKNAQDASATTATSPVANTLTAAFPSDLRAVMKPMTKYSDNTGGGTDTAGNVSATKDYLPDLAEYEVHGARTYANSAEQNYQKQYDYFKNGNSKIKYKHNATGDTAYYFCRSVDSGNTSYFCRVKPDGGAGNYSAGHSFGLAPAFKV